MNRQRIVRFDSHRTGLAIALLAAITFALLADVVTRGMTTQWDNAIRDTFNHNASPDLTMIAVHVSWLGKIATLIPAGIVTASILLLTGRRWAAAALAIDMSGALVLNGTLKLAFHRDRPTPFDGANPETFSFPSGHVLLTTCFCGGLLLIVTSKTRDLGVLASFLLVLAIGWSRIYLGAHYPSDVLGGLLVAIFWLAILVGAGLFNKAANQFGSRG